MVLAGAEDRNVLSSDTESCGKELSVPRGWREVEDSIRARVILRDDHPAWDLGSKADLSECTLKFVGGADISYETGSSTAVVALVVLSFPSLQVVASRAEEVDVNVPYFPGYLALREAQPIVKLLEDFKRESPEIWPQVLVIDGNGRFHPRLCGVACHIGVMTDLPTFGVSKNCLKVDKYGRQEAADIALTFLRRKGDFVYLRSDRLESLGALYKPSDNSKRPVFVSTGHRLTVDTCVALMSVLCKYKTCEPIRQADSLSRQRLALKSTAVKSVAKPVPAKDEDS